MALKALCSTMLVVSILFARVLSACCRFSASPPQSRTAPWCAQSVSLWAFSTYLLLACKYTHSPTTWKFSKSPPRDKNNNIFNSINCRAHRSARCGGGGGGGLAANPLCARCLRWWECGDYLALMRARKLVRQRLLNQQQQQRCNPQSIILLQTNNPRCPLRLLAGWQTDNIARRSAPVCACANRTHTHSGPNASRLNVGAER
jgi:hypothetical protein